jgi:hypothetical protein
MPDPQTQWPIVMPNDDGIRPAGSPDECFYCRQKIGSEHGWDCAVVTKTIKVRYVYEVEITVPHFWGEDLINFHLNESSWCADNGLDDLDKIIAERGCLCSVFDGEYIEDIDTTPTRKLREQR